MAECKYTPADKVHRMVDSTTAGDGKSDICQPCKVDKNIVPAVGWCETCDEMLCNECYKYHCRPTMMRSHQLKSIADMKDMKQRKSVSIKCKMHEGELLDHFCNDHAELGCSQCFVSKHRSCSRVVYIADVKTKGSKEFKAFEKLLSQFESRLKANEENIERNVGVAARQHAKAIADIKEAEDKLKAHIDELVKQQIIKAQKRNEDNMRNIACVEATHKGIAKKIKDGKQMVALEKGDNTRLFVTMKYLRVDTEVIDLELDECEKKNSVREYEFGLSSELADVLEKVKDLGTLKESQLLDLEKATDEVLDVVEVRRCTNFGTYFSEGGYINEEIVVSTNHDIRLLHVLVFASTWGDTAVSLTISEEGNCLLRCNGRHKTDEADQTVVAAKVAKEGGAHGITLQADHDYVISVTGRGEWACYYFGSLRLPEVTENGVRVFFMNRDRTTEHPIIVGLRFTII